MDEASSAEEWLRASNEERETKIILSEVELAVRHASSMLLMELGGHGGRLYHAVKEHAQEAAAIVRRRIIESGHSIAEVDTKKEFIKQLMETAKKELEKTGTHRLEENNIGEVLRKIDKAPVVVVPQKHRTVITVESSARRNIIGTLSNAFSVPITEAFGLGYTIKNISRVELLDVSMGSHFAIGPGNTRFHVGIDEITTDHNRQSDGTTLHTQFTCIARLPNNMPTSEIIIPMKYVDLQRKVSLGNNITIRIYDDAKLPIKVRRDFERIDNFSWNNDNQLYLNVMTSNTFTHDIMDGDRLRFVDLKLEGAPLLKNETVHAKFEDNSSLSFDITREGGPFPTYEGRQVDYRNAHIVNLDNVVRVTLAFEHE